jgi:hypothetical protein
LLRRYKPPAGQPPKQDGRQQDRHCPRRAECRAEREGKVGQQGKAPTKDHDSARAPTVRRAAAELGADGTGQAEAQQHERQTLRAEADDAGYEDTEISIDSEGAGRGQHAGHQHSKDIAALGQRQTLTQAGRDTRKLARQPGENPEQRERRQPGHNEEGGAPAEALPHQHAKRHADDDRQGQSGGDSGKSPATPLRPAQCCGIPAGRRHETRCGECQQQPRGQ